MLNYIHLLKILNKKLTTFGDRGVFKWKEQTLSTYLTGVVFSCFLATTTFFFVRSFCVVEVAFLVPSKSPIDPASLLRSSILKLGVSIWIDGVLKSRVISENNQKNKKQNTKV